MKYPLICAILFSMTTLQAQQDNYRSILVTGTHEMEVEPDEIILSVTISEYYEEEFVQGSTYQDYKTRHPLDDIEAQFDKALKTAKIKDDQITVEDTGNNWRPWGKDALTSKTYRISVPDFKCVTDVQKELKFRGVQSFQIAELKHKNKETLEIEVKTEALKKAKQKAKLMAAALGENIGRPITIVEAQKGYNPQPYRGMRMAEASFSDGGGGGDDFGNNFKKLKIKYSVEVRFELVIS